MGNLASAKFSMRPTCVWEKAKHEHREKNREIRKISSDDPLFFRERHVIGTKIKRSEKDSK